MSKFTLKFNLKKRELLCTVGGHISWYDHYGKQPVWRFLKKKKLSCDSAVSLLGIYSSEMRSVSQTDSYTPMFTAAFFTVAKI